MQTLKLAEVTRIIRASVRAAFPHEAYYQPWGAGAGFTLGGLRPFVRRERVPQWARYLSDELVDALSTLPRDAATALEPEPSTAPATGDGRSVVKAALTGGHGWNLSQPHPYRRDTTELYLTAEDAQGLTPGQVTLLLEGMHERSRLVVVLPDALSGTHGPALEALGYTRTAKDYEHYVARITPENKARLWTRWERLNDGSVARLDVHTGGPAEHAIVGPMLQRYLALWGGRFFDAPDSALDLEQPGRYVVTSDPEGSAVTLFKLVERDEETVEVEVFYGEGTSRQNLLSPHPAGELPRPYGSDAGDLLRAGGRVWAQPSPDRRSENGPVGGVRSVGVIGDQGRLSSFTATGSSTSSANRLDVARQGARPGANEVEPGRHGGSGTVLTAHQDDHLGGPCGQASLVIPDLSPHAQLGRRRVETRRSGPTSPRGRPSGRRAPAADTARRSWARDPGTPRDHS